MDDPSTIRRAVADIGRAPYGGDSLAGQMGDEISGIGGCWELCTMFVLGSQYVLFRLAVLACFNPLWPILNFAVAYFGFQMAVNLPRPVRRKTTVCSSTIWATPSPNRKGRLSWRPLRPRPLPLPRAQCWLQAF